MKRRSGVKQDTCLHPLFNLSLRVQSIQSCPLNNRTYVQHEGPVAKTLQVGKG